MSLYDYINAYLPLSSVSSAPTVTPASSIPPYHHSWSYGQWQNTPQAIAPYPPAFRPIPHPAAFHDQHPTSHNQGEPDVFRVALGDANSTLNQAHNSICDPSATTAAGQKRRRNKPANTNKKRNTSDTAASNGDTASTLVNIPVVGPVLQSVQDDVALHPALCRLQNDFGSLLHEESVSLNGAFDIWYFMRGQNSKTDEAIPEKDSPSSKRPCTKTYSYLRCRLCTR